MIPVQKVIGAYKDTMNLAGHQSQNFQTSKVKHAKDSSDAKNSFSEILKNMTKDDSRKQRNS